MRQEFFPQKGFQNSPDEKTYTRLSQVRKDAPWAAKIIKTYGGWRAFESVYDDLIYRDQK